MRKLEKTAAVLLGIGLLFRILYWDGADVITLLGGMLLSVLYWPFGFALLSGIRARQLFAGEVYKQRKTEHLVLAGIAGLIFACSTVAIVFCILHWSGGDVMRLISLGSLLLLAGILLVIRQELTVPGGWRSWLFRCLLLLGLLVATGFPPLSTPHRLAPATIQQ